MNMTVVITIEPNAGRTVDFKFRDSKIRDLLQQRNITDLTNVDYADVWWLEYNITKALTSDGYTYVYFETNFYGEAKY